MCGDSGEARSHDGDDERGKDNAGDGDHHQDDGKDGKDDIGQFKGLFFRFLIQVFSENGHEGNGERPFAKKSP